MKFIKFLLIIPLILILTSCVGEEPDNIAYVTAMGIDKKENGYVYTIQFAQPTKISGGSSESGGSIGDIVENISIEAPTIYSAINSADSIISKELSLSHAKIIVISKKIAKDGLGGLNDVFSRNNEIRPDIYFAISDDAGKYLEDVKPALELNPVKYYQLTYESKNASAIPSNTAFDFLSSSSSHTKDSMLPLAGVAETKEEKTKDEEKTEDNKSQKAAVENKQGFEDGTKNYYAGQAGLKIKNKSETLGSAVFKGDKYVDDIGSTETELYNILIKKFREMNISFYSDKTPENPITIRIEEKKNPKVTIDKENHKAEITVSLEGELLSASIEHKNNSSEKATENQCEQMITESAKQFTDKIYKEYNADILGIRGKIKKEFLTNNAYNEYCKNFQAKDWDIEINTVLNLKRTGMTFYY